MDKLIKIDENTFKILEEIKEITGVKGDYIDNIVISVALERHLDILKKAKYKYGNDQRFK